MNHMMNTVVELTQNLIQQPSITPDTSNCQNIISHYLKKLNFYVELMHFNNINNIWAHRKGNTKYHTKQHTLLFVGHTDVVHPGDIKNWKYPPFSGIIKNGMLYGRGASDMKGALAAMLIATENFVQKYPKHEGRIAFLITSDEEGLGLYGTIKVIEVLLNRQEHIDYCIIGEPSSTLKIGDVIKNGRRGSYSGKLVIHGIQGHVAYPQFLKNPIHLSIPILSELLTTQWDQNKSILFPKTSMQITNIHTTPTNLSNNITPDKLILNFNFRFNDQCSINNIKKKITKILEKHNLINHYIIDLENPSTPYFSNPGLLTQTVIKIIQYYQKITPTLETTGGTSDGRFITKTGAEIIELGALNQTIHQPNEYVKLTDLTTLSNIYLEIMKKILLLPK